VVFDELPTYPAAWISKGNRRQLEQLPRNRGESKMETSFPTAAGSTIPGQYLLRSLQKAEMTSPCTWPKWVPEASLNWDWTDLTSFFKDTRNQIEEFTPPKE